MADTESSTQNQRKDFCQEFNALSIEERKNNTKVRKNFSKLFFFIFLLRIKKKAAVEFPSNHF